MKYITRANSFVAQDAEGVTQLNYALQINPAPLTVSIPGENPELASLEFVVINPTRSDLLVTSVKFTIQVGTGASLTPTTAGIRKAVSDTVNWTVNGPGSTITSGPAIYTLQSPITGHPVKLGAGQSVVVQLFHIQTNSTPGATKISIQELVDSRPGITSFTVATFPTGFYFNSLAAMVHDGNGLVPVAQVGYGCAVTLTWNSSVVDINAITIYYSTSAGQSQPPAHPSAVGQWGSHGLTSDTVFTVELTTSSEGGEPLTASLTTVVAVENPDLVASTLTTTGNVGVGTATPQAKLNIINVEQDASNGNTFILGPTASSNLRLGYHGDYSWIQSQGGKPLAINPVGQNVGIGTTNPSALLQAGDSGANGSFGNVTLGIVQRASDSVGLYVMNPNGTPVLQFGTTAKSNSISMDGGGNLAVIGGFIVNGQFTAGTNPSIFNGNVGIGTKSPVAKLDIQGAPRSGTHPTSINGLYVTGDFGDSNSGVEFRHSNGSQGIGFGYNTIYATGSNATQHLNLLPNGGGNVGIGTTSPTNGKLHVAGTIYSQGTLYAGGGMVYYWGPGDGTDGWYSVQNRAGDWAGSYSASGPSDVRLKKDIRPIQGALAKALQLQGTYFHWGEQGIKYFTRDIENTMSAGPGASDEENQKLWDAERGKRIEQLTGNQIGLIAQDVESVVPEVVHTDKEGYKSIGYGHLTALLVEAIKEQNKLIENLTARINALEGVKI